MVDRTAVDESINGYPFKKGTYSDTGSWVAIIITHKALYALEISDKNSINIYTDEDDNDERIKLISVCL
jgi:hypothetical protein